MKGYEMNLNDKLFRFGLAAMVFGLMAMTFVAPAARSQPSTQSTSDQIKAIDTECNAISDAILAIKPVQLVFAKSNWKVASDEDVAVAERTHASVTIVDVWKQGKNYAWIHSHSYDQKGNQTATQLCFRQKDGTLERARQAGTVADLNGAAAASAYYASDGTVLMKTETFEVNDPAIAKKVTALPYYKELP
jgi:hypothetical protein